MPKPKIAIVYYSMYGHVRTLALAEKEGLEAAGCEVTLLKVPETLSDEVLGKLGAPGVGKDDEEASAATLADYDGFLFGLSARFGMASAQVKALLDSTGGLWQKVCAGVEEAYACRVGSMAWTGSVSTQGALVGKPAGIFFSTGTQNGGQETTALTFVTQLAHHGMVFVPLGYSTPKLFDLSAPHGGSPYGSGTIAAGDGSRQPSEHEKKVAVHHGEHFGKIVAKLAK